MSSKAFCNGRGEVNNLKPYFSALLMSIRSSWNSGKYAEELEMTLVSRVDDRGRFRSWGRQFKY